MVGWDGIRQTGRSGGRGTKQTETDQSKQVLCFAVYTAVDDASLERSAAQSSSYVAVSATCVSCGYFRYRATARKRKVYEVLGTWPVVEDGGGGGGSHGSGCI